MKINEKLLPEKDYVIEKGGSEATGYYEKWNSGKLVQWGFASFTAPLTTQHTTGWYRTASAQTKTFPVSFANNTYVPLLSALGGNVNAAYVNTRTTNSFDYYPITSWSVNNQNNKYIFYKCIGTWK